MAMNCNDVQNQLNAWIDGEADLSPEARAEFEAHLKACAPCGAAADELERQHTCLRAAFAPPRAAAASLAQRVAAQISQKPHLGQPSPPPRTRGSWTSLLLAAACGFLLATVLFQPWQRRLQVAVPDRTPAPKPLPVAQLVLSTGEVEVRAARAADWSKITATPFGCNPGAAVRTPAGGLCEFQTSEGCVIRLNNESEITFRSADVVSLKKGELWCSVPQDAALEVVADEAQHSNAPPAIGESADASDPTVLPTFMCPSGSSLLTSCENGVVSATPAAGGVAVETASGRRELKAGQAVRIVAGKSVERMDSDDPLLEARWMQPLLVRKGHDDSELARRVNDLLARVGRAKVSYLYEQEIRGLGEYCVLPLLRYVQSDQSRSDPGQRIQAMRIVADLAPAWAVRDLIDLLGDPEADVRFHAAAALKRLTAQTQGREPDAWRADPAECAETRARWLTWWEQNAARYPARGAGAKA
jgi:hypothetical protein